MTALLWVAIMLCQAQVQPPASNKHPDMGVIRGRITDKQSGAPIARARVRIGNRANSEQHVVRTDADGRYEFAGLPAGEYSGFADGGEHRAIYLMEMLRSGNRLGPIVLKEGEVRAEIDVALTRAGAVTVRVVDEWGEPLAGLRVSLKSADTGRLEPISFNQQTDDRGLIRLFRIPPARYIVCAESGSVGPNNNAGATRRERLLRTCHPSAATESQAQPVRIRDGDLEGIEIRMRLGRTFTISGMVVDSAGAPVQIPFVRLSKYEANGSSGTSVATQPDGGFRVSNVAPGDYAIQASIGGPDRPDERRPLETGFVPILVDSSDVEGVVVTMVKGVDVAGRFVSEETAVPLPASPPGSMVGPLFVAARLAADRLRGSGGSNNSAHATEDRTFLFKNLFGKRTLDVANVPRGWYVKAIRYGGTDIIDVPTELKASNDPSGLEIVLSNRGATIAGRVTDERGDPVRGARVFLLPADPARVNIFATYVTTSATGVFRAGPQRAGDYVAVALGPSGPQPMGNIDLLRRLAQLGERITLGDNDERTLDLTVVKIDP